jgi:hypothetical protein
MFIHAIILVGASALVPARPPIVSTPALAPMRSAVTSPSCRTASPPTARVEDAAYTKRGAALGLGAPMLLAGLLVLQISLLSGARPIGSASVTSASRAVRFVAKHQLQVYSLIWVPIAVTALPWGRALSALVATGAEAGAIMKYAAVGLWARSEWVLAAVRQQLSAALTAENAWVWEQSRAALTALAAWWRQSCTTLAAVAAWVRSSYARSKAQFASLLEAQLEARREARRSAAQAAEEASAMAARVESLRGTTTSVGAEADQGPPEAPTAWTQQALQQIAESKDQHEALREEMWRRWSQEGRKEDVPEERAAEPTTIAATPASGPRAWDLLDFTLASAFAAASFASFIVTSASDAARRARRAGE